MTALKRLLLVLVAAASIAGGTGVAQADRLCVGTDVKYHSPGSRPTHIQVGPYCIPIP